MKKLIMMMAAALTATFAWSDEEIAMVEKEITTITVPFGIRGYTPSNKEVVRIEKTSDTGLRLTALRSGRCDLEVRGDMDMVQKFQISVGGDLPRTLQNLRRELERIPEVHAEIVGDRIRVDGELKSIKKWNYLMKVIKGYPAVKNFVEFTPGDDILARMKESLQQSGFEVVFNKPHTGEPRSWKANSVALTYSKINRTMLVQAKVYTPEQKEKIDTCLKGEKRWLVIDVKDKDSFDDESQVKGNLQVFVAKPVIRISVAYMAIGESDLKLIGNTTAIEDQNGGFNLSGALDGIMQAISIQDRDGLSGGSSYGNRHGASASIMGNLGFNTRFFKQNGINHISDTGYTLMESWSKEGAKFKSGGTRFVKVYGRDVAELKEIPYGFTIDTKGGMIDDSNVDMEFDFGVSTIIPMDDQTYDRKEDLSKQKIVCPLGRTTLIGGFKDLVDKNTPPSGLPFLRSTPILNWFVADSQKEVTDRKLVMMVCPEIVDNTEDKKIDVEKEINIPVKTDGVKTTDEVLEERDEKKGFWRWFWF